MPVQGRSSFTGVLICMYKGNRLVQAGRQLCVMPKKVAAFGHPVHLHLSIQQQCIHTYPYHRWNIGGRVYLPPILLTRSQSIHYQRYRYTCTGTACTSVRNFVPYCSEMRIGYCCYCWLTSGIFTAVVELQSYYEQFWYFCHYNSSTINTITGNHSK